jgi:F-type H+-transporting ATPase subunit epsilon
MSQLQCIVVTPELTVLDTEAEFVALPLFDGEIGIAAGHSPMIGRLGVGEMRIRVDDTVRRYYVEGGFVEVLHNCVSVLTSRAVPAESLDPTVAQEQLLSARGRVAHTPEQFAVRDRAVAQARAQLRTASHS